MVVLKDIRVESYCEHHMVPIIGVAHVAYMPSNRVVGISKLARVVDAYSKRLQIQEKLTRQIAETIERTLQPKGVAVVIESAHQCMTTRGVHKDGVTMITSTMLGIFRRSDITRRELLAFLGILLVIVGLAMIIPAMVDLFVGHNDWQVFLVAAAVSVFAGGGLFLSNRGGSLELGRQQAFILTTAVWIVMPAAAALPFAFGEMNVSYTDAFFEAMSGLTTTGSTVLTGLAPDRRDAAFPHGNIGGDI